MDIDICWGDVERRAVTQIKVASKKDRRKDTARFVEGLVVASAEGKSSHIHGSAEVFCRLNFSREEVYQLFSAAVKASNADASIKRIAHSLLAELAKQDRVGP